MSKLTHLQLMKSRTIDYSCPDEYDPDFDSNNDSSEEDEEVVQNYTNNEDLFDDNYGDNSSDNLGKVSFSTFQGMRVFDSVNPTLSKSYFIVNINGVKKYLHQQTATWLLSKDRPTLSSGRSKRVMTDYK